MNPSKEEILNNNRDNISLLKSLGYNPIGVSQMLFEDTFVFETEEEAKKAYEHAEVELKMIQGWFYSKEGYSKAVEDYKERLKMNPPEIVWISEK